VSDEVKVRKKDWTKKKKKSKGFLAKQSWTEERAGWRALDQPTFGFQVLLGIFDTKPKCGGPQGFTDLLLFVRPCMIFELLLLLKVELDLI